MGAYAAMVGYLPVFSNDILADRSRAVGIINAVVDPFYKHGGLDLHSHGTADGGFFTI